MQQTQGISGHDPRQRRCVWKSQLSFRSGCTRLSQPIYSTHLRRRLVPQYYRCSTIAPVKPLHLYHSGIWNALWSLNPYSHLILDQATLGADTYFTFSSDILTQARLWLQNVRHKLYKEVVDRRRIPASNPMSVNQAFLLATRSGGLAIRKSDLDVLAVGAKADLVVWNGRSPSMLGWRDPVAAVVLHASVGDIKHVLVNGKFTKRDWKLTASNHATMRIGSCGVQRGYKRFGQICLYLF